MEHSYSDSAGLSGNKVHVFMEDDEPNGSDLPQSVSFVTKDFGAYAVSEQSDGSYVFCISISKQPLC